MANKKLNAVITIGGTVTGALKSALGTTRTKLREIGSAVRDLEKEQRRLQAGIRDGMNMGRPVGHLVDQYRRLETQIGRTRREQERMTRAARGMDKGKAMMGSAAAGIGAAAAVAATGGLPIVHAAQFETAMLGVAKQVEGARDKAGKLTAVYHDMAKQIQQLGREVPVPTNELAKMAEAGARMGIARENLIGFTRTTAMMATALQLPREELADDMGKIATLYKMPIPAISQLGDAINYLDDNAVSKGGDIVNFLKRTGGVAGAVKVTGKQMAALGSTLLSLGEPAETAGTATNALFQKFAAAEKGTKKFRGAMKSLGLSTAAVQKGMQVDAQATVMKVMDAVNKLPKDQRLGVLVDLVGLEHSDTIAKLATNMAEYRKQIGLVNSEKANGSMNREFAATLETTSAQFEVLKNRAMEVSVNIGSVLLPVVNQAMTVIGGVASAVADWARENPKLVQTIATVAGTVLGVVGAFKLGALAVGAVRFAFNALRMAIMTNPIGLIITAIAVGAVLIYQNWEPIKAFFLDTWESIKVGAGKAWEFIKSVFLNATPLGLVISNWGPLKTYFAGLFDDIMATARSAIDWVLQKIAAVGNAWNATKEFFGMGGGAPAAGPAGASGRQPPAAPSMATARGGAPSVTNKNTNTFNITQQPGQDSRALAREVAAHMAQDQRTKSGSMLYDRPRGY